MQPIISVMVLGISILLPNQKDEQSMSMWNMIKPGTSVMVKFTAAEGYTILGLNEDECKLVKFTDDTGKDMTPTEDNSSFGGQKWLETSMFNTGAPTMMFVIRTNQYAAAGAKSISIQADLSVKLAKGEKTVKADKVALVKKTKFKINEIEFTVTKVKQTKDWEGNKCTEITVQYKKKLDDLKTVVFKDPESGEEIESGGISTSSFSSFGDVFQGDKTFRLKDAKDIKEVNIEMVFYDDLKNEKVTVKQTVGLSLSGK